MKEQFAPEENRDIAFFNTDDEFSRAINDGVNVQNLIQKIDNHPHRHAFQRDLQQHRQLNLFSKESRDVTKAAGKL